MAICCEKCRHPFNPERVLQRMFCCWKLEQTGFEPGSERFSVYFPDLSPRYCHRDLTAQQAWEAINFYLRFAGLPELVLAA